MAKNRLFIPQDTLNSWIEEERAQVADNELTLTDEDQKYLLAPAVHFVREATGTEDPHDLVGRVKEETQLTILGADTYMDSVILNDNAYDVRRGFAAVPAVERSAPSRPAPPPEEAFDTSDALAAFLLQQLR